MWWMWYLFARLGIKENPTKLNDLGGVLGNIDAVLITRCGYVYHHITFEVRRLGRGGGLGSHVTIAEGASNSVISQI